MIKAANVSIVAQDLHIPFEDATCVSILLRHIRKRQPAKVILPGDISDFYSISKFDKDPRRVSKNNLRDEIQAVTGFLRELRSAAPDSKIIYIQGNHEQRLQKYVFRHAPALAWLEELELPRLLKLKDLGIEYYTDGYWLGDLFITHGTQLSQHAGESARKEYVKNGCSGMSGHSHRDGKYAIRNRLGQFVWYENYCMCDLKPDYIEGVANWSSGFSEVTLTGKRPEVHQIPIINGSYTYNGKRYEGARDGKDKAA